MILSALVCSSFILIKFLFSYCRFSRSVFNYFRVSSFLMSFLSLLQTDYSCFFMILILLLKLTTSVCYFFNYNLLFLVSSSYFSLVLCLYYFPMTSSNCCDNSNNFVFNFIFCQISFYLSQGDSRNLCYFFSPFGDWLLLSLFQPDDAYYFLMLNQCDYLILIIRSKLQAYSSIKQNSFAYIFKDMQGQLLKRSKVLADKFLQFVNASPSAFHVVDWCRTLLSNKGFKELSDNSNWEVQKGAKYFFTRNNSTVVAFHIGDAFDPANTGFKIIGAHTDSPCLKIAPVSKAKSKNFSQSYVMTYGGGLWHTWFDRDLILAGKVVYQKQGKFTSKLWRSQKPLLKIPNLAIHLRTDRNKFEPNTETELRPILSSETYQKQLGHKISEEAEIFQKHNSRLIQIISNDIGVQPESIIDFDLSFADYQPSSYCGLDEDFISSPRLDNLFSSFHAILAISESENPGSFVNMAALFDHEQCGSQSAQGAGSPIVAQSIRRIYKLLCGQEDKGDNFEKTMQRSFIISADMAHGVHPNYSDKHQTNHQVQINKGVVIKLNHNQRYSSDLVSTSLFKIVAKRCKTPIQQVIVKNDSPCGSTIGPILASGTGIKSVDVGCAMWGMHSIRETCGTLDGVYYQDIFRQFYNSFEKINHDLLDH